MVSANRIVAGAALAVLLCAGAPAGAATIIDEWKSVEVPPPPKLEPITVDPKTTALLVLDLIKETCNDKVRPRCVASVPKVASLLKAARASNTMVVYSLSPGAASKDDILPEVAPVGNEPMVRSGVDKFAGTDLEKILKDKGITTVIVVGTTAQGAVLYTASLAAILGFNVIVPVDGMSAEIPYAEQYVAWNMVHAPLVSSKTKLTAIDLLTF